MSQANKDLIRTIAGIWDEGALSELDQYFAPDFKVHGGVPGIPATLEGVRIAHSMASATFPSCQITISEILAEEDKVFVRSKGTCKTSGGARFWPGDTTDTAKEFHFEGWSVYRIADGKVAEAWRLSQTSDSVPSSDSTPRTYAVITTEDIRRWATALPEVEESSHFMFHVPVFKVRGKTFAGVGKNETTAVFCVSEQQARSAAAAAPATCEAVRRMDARRSFLGLQVQLSHVSETRIRGLVEDAWRHKAPRRLLGEYDSGKSSAAR